MDGLSIATIVLGLLCIGLLVYIFHTSKPDEKKEEASIKAPVKQEERSHQKYDINAHGKIVEAPVIQYLIEY